VGDTAGGGVGTVVDVGDTAGGQFVGAVTSPEFDVEKLSE
jgi:hypothetical protein